MTATYRPLALAGVQLVEPGTFKDTRGVFFESFDAREFAAATGEAVAFVQDYHSESAKGVLRGLHYQWPRAQGKLVRVVEGEVFDVVVDLREKSSTCGRWVAETLSAANRRMLWIPAGFAHGFLVLGERATVLYKVTTHYDADAQQCIRWDDADLSIDWPLKESPLVSARDTQGRPFATAPRFR